MATSICTMAASSSSRPRLVLNLWIRSNSSPTSSSFPDGMTAVTNLRDPKILWIRLRPSSSLAIHTRMTSLRKRWWLWTLKKSSSECALLDWNNCKPFLPSLIRTAFLMSHVRMRVKGEEGKSLTGRKGLWVPWKTAHPIHWLHTWTRGKKSELICARRQTKFYPLWTRPLSRQFLGEDLLTFKILSPIPLRWWNILIMSSVAWWEDDVLTSVRSQPRRLVSRCWSPNDSRENCAIQLLLLLY